ncbi:dihydrolipoamide dehydrogenase [Arsenicitalea aurantiaca]|uniref:Dihydrolipoamide dehydrogenase n=1 Tax=Arsenicitalea aurantiaca TaxID=1783274 RepID=A0A433X288_9HYPH|nr:FAD-dependent oxidoreductase [Arsenicitalea aurantiaca]RUT28226.1 dihydrolipoamide dehydrogenase [Arsenicitalea aurantiaca]
MAEYLTPDLCIIGAGSGGLSVAAAARAFGASVVIVEKGEMGGDCLNFGCVPSKALIAAGRHAHAMRSGEPFGITGQDPQISFRRVQEHIQDVIAGIAPHDSVSRFEGLGATVIKAEGKFVDPRTLSAGDQLIRARRFVIATGSVPSVPQIPGLDQVPYFTNETIFSNTRKLTHLAIIGGGPIGIELAQAYRRLGSAVTVIEATTPLQRSDPELAEIALRRVAEDGVDIRSNTRVVEIQPRSQGIGVLIESGEAREVLDVSHILVAVGRTPNLEPLDLAKAKVRRDRKPPHRLRIGKNLKTSNRRIYVLGDAAGGQQFTHFANYQAGLVIRNALFGLPVSEKPELIPHATYCDPEIAEIGVTEPVARRRHKEGYRVVRWSFAENDRARTERETYGLAKMIVDRRGRIVGAGIVGAGAGELIALFSFAIANRLKASHLLNFVAPYPTLSEIAKRLGTEYFREQTHNPWLRRIIALNRFLP